MPPSIVDDLCFLPAVDLAAKIRAKEVSPVEAVDAVLARIESLNPKLNAFCFLHADEARQQARAAEAAVLRGDDLGPLHGVPVSVKDNVPIAIKDDTDVAGQVTMRGSLAHDGAAGRPESEVVRRLRAAGAGIVGKTHIPELEALAMTESLAFGATHKPWDHARTPGGSSGGSAAAVAAGLVGAALGTDGAGSIRMPAACCGIYGLKPQRDRVPMGHNWLGMSVTGALTRRVIDTALFLDAAKEPGPSFADAAQRPPGKLRIAYSMRAPRGAPGRLDDEQRATVERTAERLRDLGHAVVERDHDYGAGALKVVTRYLEGISADAAAMPHPERLARPTRGLASLGSKIPGFVISRAHEQEEADRDRAGKLLEEFDVLMTPVVTHRPPLIGEWWGLPAPVMLNSMMSFVPHAAFWNHTGQPAASVPVEVADDGFPLSVQLVGRSDDEPTLLSLSAQLEEATGWPARRPAFAT